VGAQANSKNCSGTASHWCALVPVKGIEVADIYIQKTINYFHDAALRTYRYGRVAVVCWDRGCPVCLTLLKSRYDVRSDHVHQDRCRQGDRLTYCRNISGEASLCMKRAQPWLTQLLCSHVNCDVGEWTGRVPVAAGGVPLLTPGTMLRNRSSSGGMLNLVKRLFSSSNQQLSGLPPTVLEQLAVAPFEVQKVSEQLQQKLAPRLTTECYRRAWQAPTPHIQAGSGSRTPLVSTVTRADCCCCCCCRPWRSHQTHPLLSVSPGLQFKDAGRGLVATKDIQYGEVLLTEQPYVCCPSLSNRKKVRPPLL
jgi:hypothetical protein